MSKVTSWLSFVMSNCEVATLVSWVRCGAGLYRFLIFVPFLSFDCVNTLFRLCQHWFLTVSTFVSDCVNIVSDYVKRIVECVEGVIDCVIIVLRLCQHCV